MANQVDTFVIGDYIKVTYRSKKYCCKVTRKRKGKERADDETFEYIDITCVPVCEWKTIHAEGTPTNSDEEWLIRAKVVIFGQQLNFTYELYKIYDLKKEDYKLHEPKTVQIRMYTRKKVIDFLFEMTKTLSIGKFEHTNMSIYVHIQDNVESEQHDLIHRYEHSAEVPIRLTPFYVHHGTLYDKDRNLQEGQIIQLFLTVDYETDFMACLQWQPSSPWAVKFEENIPVDFNNKPVPELYEFISRKRGIKYTADQVVIWGKLPPDVERRQLAKFHIPRVIQSSIVSDLDIMWKVNFQHHPRLASVEKMYDPMLDIVENMTNIIKDIQNVGTIVVKNAIGNPLPQQVQLQDPYYLPVVSRGMDLVAEPYLYQYTPALITNLRHFYCSDEINDFGGFKKLEKKEFGVASLSVVERLLALERVIGITPEGMANHTRLANLEQDLDITTPTGPLNPDEYPNRLTVLENVTGRRGQLSLDRDIKLFGLIEKIKQCYDTETRVVHSVGFGESSIPIFNKSSVEVLENKMYVFSLERGRERPGIIPLEEAEFYQLNLYYSERNRPDINVNIKLQWPIIYDSNGDDFISYVGKIRLKRQFGRDYVRLADRKSNPLVASEVTEPERDPRGLTKPSNKHITVKICDAIWNEIKKLAETTNVVEGGITMKDPNTLQIFSELNYRLQEWDKENASIDTILLIMDGQRHVLWAHQNHNLQMPYQAGQRGLQFTLKGKVSIEVLFKIDEKRPVEQDLTMPEKQFALGNLNGCTMFETCHFRQTDLVQILLSRNPTITKKTKGHVVNLNGRTQFGDSLDMLTLCGYPLIKEMFELQHLQRNTKMKLIDEIWIKDAKVRIARLEDEIDTLVSQPPQKKSRGGETDLEKAMRDKKLLEEEKCDYCQENGTNCYFGCCSVLPETGLRGHSFHVGCIYKDILSEPRSDVRYLVHESVIPQNGENTLYTLYPNSEGLPIEKTIYVKPKLVIGEPPSMRMFYFDARCPDCNELIDPNPQVIVPIYDDEKVCTQHDKDKFCGLKMVPLYKMIDQLQGYNIYKYEGTDVSPWKKEKLIRYEPGKPVVHLSIQKYLRKTYLKDVKPIIYKEGVEVFMWGELRHLQLRLDDARCDLENVVKVKVVEKRWIFNIKGKKLILDHPSTFSSLLGAILSGSRKLDQTETSVDGQMVNIRESFVPQGHEISRVINMTNNKILNNKQLQAAANAETLIEYIYTKPAWVDGEWPSEDCPINLMLQTKQKPTVKLNIKYLKFSYCGGIEMHEVGEVMVNMDESFEDWQLLPLENQTDDIVKCTVYGSDDNREHSAAALKDAIRHTWGDFLLPQVVGFYEDKAIRYLNITVERLLYEEPKLPSEEQVAAARLVNIPTSFGFPYPTDVQYIHVNIDNGDGTKRAPIVYKFPSWIYNPGKLPNYHKHIALFLQEYVTTTQDLWNLGRGYYVPWAMTCNTNDGVRGIYLDGSFTFGNSDRAGFRDVESCLTGKTTLETMQWENMGFGALGLKNLDDVPRMVGRKRGIQELVIRTGGIGINIHVQRVDYNPTRYKMPTPYYNFMAVKLIDVGSAPTEFEIAEYKKQEEIANALGSFTGTVFEQPDPSNSPKIWRARQTMDRRLMRLEKSVTTYKQIAVHASNLLTRMSKGVMFEGVSFDIKNIAITLGDRYFVLPTGQKMSSDKVIQYIQTYFSERYYKTPGPAWVEEDEGASSTDGAINLGQRFDWISAWDSYSNDYFHEYCPYLFVFVEGSKNKHKFEAIFHTSQAQYEVFESSVPSSRSRQTSGLLSNPSVRYSPIASSYRSSTASTLTDPLGVEENMSVGGSQGLMARNVRRRSHVDLESQFKNLNLKF